MHDPLMDRFSPSELPEIRAALLCALRCLTDAQMADRTDPTDPTDRSDLTSIAEHRRTLCRLYCRLSERLPVWEVEQRVPLLEQCCQVLRIFAGRLTGAPRQNVELLARQVGRLGTMPEAEEPDGV